MRRSTLIMTVLLVLSAAGNLAVLGLFAGHWLHGNNNPPGAANGVERLVGWVPGPVRLEIDQAMRPRNDEVKAQLMALRAAHRAAVDALRLRPFDPVRAEAAMAELRQASVRLQEKLHRTILERMSAAQEAGNLPPPPERGPRAKAQRDAPPLRN